MFERMFGFFQKEKPTVSPSPVTPVVNGSAVYSYGSMAGCYGFSLDLDATLRNELQMTNYYREISTYPDCDRAIEQIVNEAVILDEAKPPVTISLDDLPKEYGKLKNAIAKEFETVLDLYSFNENCHDIFKRWYIDGRLYYFVTIDPKHPKKGILDVRYVDPRKIKRVTEIKKEKDENGVDIVTDVNEYYVFNDEGLLDHSNGIKIRTDSVIDVRSGLIDANTGEVISHLFKAIKPVNQLKMMEDALVIYRITRAPERRIFYVDTGNLPPPKAEQQVQMIMNKFRNKVVYDAKTGEIRNNRNYLSMMEDFWLPRRDGGKSTEVTTLPGCLAMDTTVSLLDGRELSIREISNEMQDGKTLWTYSCNPITGEIVPGLITWAGVTQKSAKVMRITLDNGESIVCTLDHKFPIRGVGFVRADELKANDSLIPLHRKYAPINSNKKLDYEEYFDNVSKTWKFTHRMVAEYIHSEKLPNQVIHHKDFNRYNKRQKLILTDEIVKFVVDCVKGKSAFDATADDVVELLNSNAVMVEELNQANRGKSIPNFYGIFTKNIICKEIPKMLGFRSWRDFRKNCGYINHRVASIEWLDDPIEVGTLTIDGNEIYHNYHTFALACGVFTKNSQNLSDIADVEYFQNKLYQSMGVPRNRIAADNNFALGRPTEITREEILFSKFIQRLRNNFNDLFRNTLRVQLLAKNIVSDSDWKKIVGKIRFEYQHDNYFEELKRQEIFGEKISQLQNIDQFKGMYFSREWIVKNVLRFGDDEWKKIQKEMKKEASDPSAADDLSSMGFGSEGSGEKKDDGESSSKKEPPERKDEDAKEDGEESNE